MSENEKKKKPNDDEWSFEDSHSGFSKEAKMGLAIIVVIGSVLGYLGYHKFGAGNSTENEPVVLNEESTEKPGEPQENEFTSLPSVNSDSNPFGESAAQSQQEPDTNSVGDQSNNTGTENLSQNGESLASNPFAGNDTNDHPNRTSKSNNETEDQNENGGNPFGNRESADPQTNSDKPLAETESAKFLGKQDSHDEHPPQTDRESFQHDSEKTDSAITEQRNEFSKPVRENNQKDFEKTETRTAGFETGSKPDRFTQNNKTDSSDWNSQDSNTRTNRATNQNQDNRFGEYRPTSTAQNSRSNRHQPESSNFNSTSKPANGYDASDNNSSNGSRYRQSQPTAPLPLSTDRPRYHKIANGDNYWKISKKYYQAGRYFRALEAYNKHRISNPKKMREGMIVLIPSKEILNRRFRKYISGGGNSSNNRNRSPLVKSGYFRGSNGQPMYRTGKNDVLTQIAEKHLGRSSRWIQIYEMNRQILKNPNNLKIGIELRLPSDASNVRIVQDFREIR